MFDVIVVGARCAGSPLAMLLARRGHRVLVVDRAKFPSDTVSTHVVHPRGSAALQEWGLLERLEATGCPPMHTYRLDFGDVAVSGSPALPGAPPAYCPRRTVLDKLLVDAAREAGAEVREGWPVAEIVVDGGRVTGVRGRDGLVERACVVVGADGQNSRVARVVDAPAYNQQPVLQSGYYAYYRDLPVNGFEIYIRPDRAFGAAPTHDGLTMVVGGWPVAEQAANRTDVEGNFARMLDLAPSFARRVRDASRVTKFVGGSTPNFFRKPYGEGWALVGDAGYTKDPITAQGITDAFRDAGLCARALDDALTGRRDFDDALGGYQAARDDAAAHAYEHTCQAATMQPPPADVLRLVNAIAGNQEAMDGFVRMSIGTIPAEEFMRLVAVET